MSITNTSTTVNQKQHNTMLYQAIPLTTLNPITSVTTHQSNHLQNLTQYHGKNTSNNLSKNHLKNYQSLPISQDDYNENQLEFATDDSECRTDNNIVIHNDINYGNNHFNTITDDKILKLNSFPNNLSDKHNNQMNNNNNNLSKSTAETMLYDIGPYAMLKSSLSWHIASCMII
jgi:hypothetical protein